MRKPISRAKLEANRRNAQKSTGPCTSEGKDKSSANSTKHGMCSKKSACLPFEDPADLEELERALRRELKPKGPWEERLFRQIVFSARLQDRARLALEIAPFKGELGADFDFKTLTKGVKTDLLLVRYQRESSSIADKAYRELKAHQRMRKASKKAHRQQS